jgi:DNA-binding PadR family transcriptional regulator
MKRASRRSPLALALLALLFEEPMHPYRMQQLIKERSKDEVINVRLRASLYQTIERLLRDGLIAVHETARTENRPERTVYRLTELGCETANDWLRQMLATPAQEFPEFPAAISLMSLLEPREVLVQLEERASALAAQLEAREERMRQFGPLLPRVVTVEDDYLIAIGRAELAWVQGVIDDLRDGRLAWTTEELRAFARQFSRSAAEAAMEGR